MKLIAIEEHFRAPSLRQPLPHNGSVSKPSEADPMAERLAKLDDLGHARVNDMDSAGIDIQVLSLTASSRLDPEHEVDSAKQANDELAKAIASNPSRLAGFASLPLSDPAASAAELARAVTTLGFKGALVNGTYNDLFLDDPRFLPIFEAAEQLQVPIYLHPAEPPTAVRNAYYKGLDPKTAQLLATSAWGWHVETGLHALRLIVSGLFDRFPSLRVIIGHMGEAVPFMLARTSRNLDGVTRIERSVSDYFLNNFYITTSGMFAVQPLLCLLLVVGADRVIFSVDYPYSSNKEGKEFLENAPISPSDREKISHLNAEQLLGL